ncbi:MAG: NAD-dependent epimerase/dehydratase family protein [Salibacteraceae bacterium]
MPSLVTGATGIVGSQIVRQLLEKNRKVRILVRDGSNRTALTQLMKFHNLSADLLEEVRGDVLDPVSLDRAIDGCDVVYHAAALVSFHPRDIALMHETNVKGTANIVDACLRHEVDALAYVSSTAAIGDGRVEGMQREDSPWTTDKGKSQYALTKRYAELEVMRGHQEGLNIGVVNPGIIIGPGKWGASSTSMITACTNGMTFYPPGSNGFSDARDVAAFLIHIIDSGWFGKRCLLINENLTFKEVFRAICEKLNTRTPAIELPAWLIRAAGAVMLPLELVGVSFGSVTAHSLWSSARSVKFSSIHLEDSGFALKHSIAEAVDYTVNVFRATHGN